MNTNTKNPIRIAAAIAILAALTTGAQAQDAPQVHVKYADLKLDNTAGATVLYQRIRFAADQVCGVRDTRDLGRLGRAKVCAAQAIAGAVAGVNAPALTEVYKNKMGVTPNAQLAAAR